MLAVLVYHVTGTAATNAVDWCLGGVVHDLLLTSEFFIEAEDAARAFSAVAEGVACTATAGGKDMCGWWWWKSLGC